MKKAILFLLTSVVIFFNSCTNGQAQSGNNNLSAQDFSTKIKELSAAQIVDVRTPEEYAKGHLENAKNINWNGNDFDAQTAKLDKAKPVFVYCLSGVRSASAASKMRKDGFTQVYELNGGIMKWRGANLPESTTVKSAGMSKAQFDGLVNSDKIVLIDFYADWCGPCQKMKPYLAEIATDRKDQVTVIRINADDNQSLCKELKIDALPVLQVYKGNKQTWTYQGFITKEEVVKQLD